MLRYLLDKYLDKYTTFIILFYYLWIPVKFNVPFTATTVILGGIRTSSASSNNAVQLSPGQNPPIEPYCSSEQTTKVVAGLSSTAEMLYKNATYRNERTSKLTSSQVWPWYVAVERSGEFICGAALISEDWVISAGE